MSRFPTPYHARSKRCSRCGKLRRPRPHGQQRPTTAGPSKLPLWLPPSVLGFAAGDWRIGPTGNPVLAPGGSISIGEDCCCCTSCCEPGTAPPQIEVNANLTPPAFWNDALGCGAGCLALDDVFLLDFHSVLLGNDAGGGAGTCVWRYCGEIDCDAFGGGTVPAPFMWQVGINSTGLACEAYASCTIGGEGATADCDDFSTYPPFTGTYGTYTWTADLPTDPDDCCDALSSPFTLDPPTTFSGSPGCNILNLASADITIQAVGC
jgi:hypothetical protein